MKVRLRMRRVLTAVILVLIFPAILFIGCDLLKRENIDEYKSTETTTEEETTQTAQKTTEPMSDTTDEVDENQITNTQTATTPNNPTTKKRVAITFDDGPHPLYTRKITNKLKEYNAHATFFVVGNRISGEEGKAIKYAHENGNEFAIHGYTHLYYYDRCSSSIFREELQKTEDAIVKYTGVKPTLMRPPGGCTTPERNQESGYAVILWNVDSVDWKYKESGKANVDKIVENVMNNVSDGDIILMHEIYENSYQALCIIMEKLNKMGYEVVTVSELLGKDNIIPGSQYRGY